MTRGLALVLLSAALPSSAQSSSACSSTCHLAEHASWQQSMHARSWTEPLFQASFGRARMRAWCRTCHTPDRSQPTAGITCEVCHLHDGVVLASKVPSPEAVQAHPIREDEGLSTTVCARCHQFRQPVLDRFPRQDTATWAQHTVSEWRDTGTTKSCADCHFKTHASTGAHDLERLRSVLSVEQLESGEVQVQVGNVGHRVPTGDPFRALVFEACASAECGTVLKRYTFGRSLRESDAGIVDDLDTRLEPSTTRVLVVPREGRWWQLRMIYAEPGLEGHLPPAAVSQIISSGAFK